MKQAEAACDRNLQYINKELDAEAEADLPFEFYIKAVYLECIAALTEGPKPCSCDDLQHRSPEERAWQQAFVNGFLLGPNGLLKVINHLPILAQAVQTRVGKNAAQKIRTQLRTAALRILFWIKYYRCCIERKKWDLPEFTAFSISLKKAESRQVVSNVHSSINVSLISFQMGDDAFTYTISESLNGDLSMTELMDELREDFGNLIFTDSEYAPCYSLKGLKAVLNAFQNFADNASVDGLYYDKLRLLLSVSEKLSSFVNEKARPVSSNPLCNVPSLKCCQPRPKPRPRPTAASSTPTPAVSHTATSSNPLDATREYLRMVQKLNSDQIRILWMRSLLSLAPVKTSFAELLPENIRAAHSTALQTPSSFTPTQFKAERNCLLLVRIFLSLMSLRGLHSKRLFILIRLYSKILRRMY